MVAEAGRDADCPVSIVIPVLSDADALGRLLEALGAGPGAELIVVDAGPEADAAMHDLRAKRPDVRWLRAARGRGAQMNAGAWQARGRWLLFLHADTVLGHGWPEVIARADADPAIAGGSFRLVLDSRSPWARVIEAGVRLRVRCFGLPYGDQALFVRRQVFAELDGYREMPLMEDVDLVRRLRAKGRMLHAEVPAVTSARRWERDGWLRRSIENMVLVGLFFAGCSPERLARRYHRRR